VTERMLEQGVNIVSLKTEPSVLAGLIQGFVVAVIALLIAFGVTITQEQTAAILGLVGVVLAIGTTLFIRSKVTPSG
jgi:hypothetical protein